MTEVQRILNLYSRKDPSGTGSRVDGLSRNDVVEKEPPIGN